MLAGSLLRNSLSRSRGFTTLAPGNVPRQGHLTKLLRVSRHLLLLLQIMPCYGPDQRSMNRIRQGSHRNHRYFNRIGQLLCVKNGVHFAFNVKSHGRVTFSSPLISEAPRILSRPEAECWLQQTCRHCHHNRGACRKACLYKS